LEPPASERAQRLVRTETSQEPLANAPLLAQAGELPKPLPDPASDKIAEIILRIEALERQMTALAGAPPPPGGHALISDIKAAVCRRYRLAAADIEGPSRRVRVMRARHMAIYLARRLTGKSFAAIARSFGERGHTAVVKACKKIERLRASDAELDRELRDLAALLRPRPAPDRPENSAIATQGGEPLGAPPEEPNHE
jgi:hypothetical protein